MSKKKRLSKYAKKLKLNKATKRAYYIALTLLLPVSFASFSVSFTNLAGDPILSTIAFIVGFLSFTIFLFVAAISFIALYYGRIIDSLRAEITKMQEGAAITLSMATSQINEILEKMADGTMMMLPETEFNEIDPDPEPLVSIRQLTMPKDIKERRNHEL